MHDHENEERLAAQAGDQQRQVGIDPPEFVEHDVLRDELHLGRQHQGKDHAGKPEVPAREPHAGESVRHDRRGKDGEKRGQSGIHEGILEKDGKTDAADPLPSIQIVFEGPLFWNEGCDRGPYLGWAF